MFDIIAIPFEYILNFFESITGNYAVAIILFTVAVQLLMFPLSVKQQKSMAKQAKLRPKLDALKEKCGDDRQKYSMEMNELYQRENISPMGGCMPMLIRMLLLLGVYQAVRNMVGNTNVDTSSFMLFGIDLSEPLKFSTDIIHNFNINWILAIICFVTSFLSMYISNKQQQHINPDMQQQGGSMKGMMFIFPFMSLFICFSVQGAFAFYWICSNVINTAVQLIVNNFFSADKIIAKETAQLGKEMRDKERERTAK